MDGTTDPRPADGAYPVPPSLPGLMRDFTRAVLRDQPADAALVQYAADYFHTLAGACTSDDEDDDDSSKRSRSKSSNTETDTGQSAGVSVCGRRHAECEDTHAVVERGAEGRFFVVCDGHGGAAVAAAVARAHGDTLPRAAALFLARTLSDGVLAAYDAVLAALQPPAVAPETAVQLWFDVYAVGELFSARTALADPCDAAAAALGAALQPPDSSSDAWPARVAHTVAAAQALLDPVECGYFRPHMRACVVRALQRSALLYAVYNPALCSTSTATASNGSMASETATALPCARVAGRFALLPSTSSIPVAAAALATPWPAPAPLLPRRAAAPADSPAPLAASAPAQRTQRDDTLLMAMGSFF